MNKRQIILDFTSLLDVIMIILFFFILFSHLETLDAKESLQSAEQSANNREQQAQSLIEDNEKLKEELYKKQQEAEEKIKEAEQAGDRQGKNVEGITEFATGKNIRTRLVTSGGGKSWQLLLYKGKEQVTVIDKGGIYGMSDAFLKALTDMGFGTDDTMLCVYIYDATQAGTASADRDVQRVFDNVKAKYPHFFISEIDISIFEEG